MANFFASEELFCRLLLLPTINIYRPIFLPTFFYKREDLVFFNLKLSLVYLIDLKID